MSGSIYAFVEDILSKLQTAHPDPRGRGVDLAGSTRSLAVAFLSPAWPMDTAANGIVSYVDGMTGALRRLGHYACILSAHSTYVNAPADVYLLEQEKRSLLAQIRESLGFRIDPARALRVRFARALARAARRAVTERGIELLEMEETFGLVQLVKPQLPVPVVVRLHGPHFLIGKALGVPINTGFNRRVRDEGVGIAKADAVSAPSRDLLERTRAYYGLPLAEAVIIPNPAPAVPAERRWSLGECDRSRLLFVGRFDRVKGGDVVINAFNQVVQRAPQLRLWIAGPDQGLTDEHGHHRTLAKYIAERAPDVAGRIDWLGQQPNSAVAELRRKAFMTIVASRYENFPMVVLEAMTYSCPLVATRIGGITEMIKHGVNGMLVSPGDTDDLAANIIRLLEAPALAAKLGQRAGEDAARRYHPDIIGRETAAFYQALLKDRNRLAC